MKALFAMATVGAALASFSAPASADPYDHFRFEHRDRDFVHIGWYCGPDQHLNRDGYCVWNHFHVGPFVIIRPFWR